jgi:hypothetical protein
MKLVVAHFLAHYDFEQMASMPKGFCLATMLIPSISHKSVFGVGKINPTHRESNWARKPIKQLILDPTATSILTPVLIMLLVVDSVALFMNKTN